jgi:hypothetical protein
MSLSRIACLLAASLIASTAYAGDEEVVTSARAALPAASSDSSSSDSASTATLPTDAQPQPLYAKPQGYESNGRTIHGGGGVSVGTGGYRSGYVYTLIPVGEDSTLGLAYSQTDYGKNGAYGWGDYGYDGYGYGGYGRGYGYGGRGGSSRSASVMLHLGDSHGSDNDDRCAPGFRDGDRTIEPVWVTKARGHACKADPSDPSN